MSLFAVGRTHFGIGHRFNGRFVGAYTEYLHLDSDFGQKIFQEHGLAGQSVPGETSYRVHNYLVGYTGQVITALCIHVGIGNQKLTALLEIGQCAVNGL